MKIKYILTGILLSLLLSSTLMAQSPKIGYANLEIVMLYMPETKSMNQQLQTYQKKLAENLQTKESYAQQRLQEYMELQERGNAPAEQIKSMEEELTKLDQELQTSASESQEKLGRKRAELLEPILEKMQKAIDAIAQENGYDFILNTMDGTGMSIVLHGPEEHDLTQKLMTKLGIEIPKQ